MSAWHSWNPKVESIAEMWISEHEPVALNVSLKNRRLKILYINLHADDGLFEMYHLEIEHDRAECILHALPQFSFDSHLIRIAVIWCRLKGVQRQRHVLEQGARFLTCSFRLVGRHRLFFKHNEDSLKRHTFFHNFVTRLVTCCSPHITNINTAGDNKTQHLIVCKHSITYNLINTHVRSECNPARCCAFYLWEELSAGDKFRLINLIIDNVKAVHRNREAFFHCCCWIN